MLSKVRSPDVPLLFFTVTLGKFWSFLVIVHPLSTFVFSNLNCNHVVTIVLKTKNRKKLFK